MSKKPVESKALAVAEAAPLPAIPEAKVSRWGKGPELSARDLIISKLLAMQGMSTKVTDGEAVFGEIRDSVSNEAYATFQKKIEVLPFHWNKVWVESEYDEKADDYNYVRQYPVTFENENQKFEEEVDGVTLKRVLTVNMYCVLPHELKLNPKAFPKIIPFRGSSLRNGRKLMTQMSQGVAAGKGPAAFTYLLGTVKTTNDKGTFAVLDCELSRETSEQEQDSAFEWYQLLTKNPQAMKVDDSDLNEATVVETEPEGTTGKF
jgi:hypothetical protein